jgi:hypothetical protein
VIQRLDATLQAPPDGMHRRAVSLFASAFPDRSP